MHFALFRILQIASICIVQHISSGLDGATLASLRHGACGRNDQEMPMKAWTVADAWATAPPGAACPARPRPPERCWCAWRLRAELCRSADDRRAAIRNARPCPSPRGWSWQARSRRWVPAPKARPPARAWRPVSRTAALPNMPSSRSTGCWRCPTPCPLPMPPRSRSPMAPRIWRWRTRPRLQPGETLFVTGRRGRRGPDGGRDRPPDGRAGHRPGAGRRKGRHCPRRRRR